MIPTLWKYISGQVLRLFLVSLLCFVLILELVDLFANITTYISYDVPIGAILRLALLYIPKAVSYAVSPALLFSVTYFLASMYGANELISVLNSGISFLRLIVPIIFIGAVVSLISLVFTESVVIDSFKEKEEYSAELLGFSNRANNNQVVIPSRITSEELGGEYRIIYYAKYYNDEDTRLTNPVIFILDGDNRLRQRIEASTARFNSDSRLWDFSDVIIYDFLNGTTRAAYESLMRADLDLRPEYFRNTDDEIANLRFDEARLLLSRIESVNYNQYRSLYIDLLERLSFSFTPLVVIMISCAFAWRFKKNILLFSILISLGLTVLYYVVSMVSILLAKQGFISPLAGVLIPFLLFTAFGTVLLRSVRT